ncbi:uncharacterized protein TNCV_203441 [Trichonephila clavipes]|nr:uncharacterized protein TNCV_203441 [Trichonephila clavipes]
MTRSSASYRETMILLVLAWLVGRKVASLSMEPNLNSSFDTASPIVQLCILKKSRKKCRPLAELPHAQSSLNASPQSSQQRSEERIPRLSRRDGTPYPGVQGIRETPKRRQRTTANTRRT